VDQSNAYCSKAGNDMSPFANLQTLVREDNMKPMFGQVNALITRHISVITTLDLAPFQGTYHLTKIVPVCIRKSLAVGFLSIWL
jgi:hypothetical protein